MQTIQIDGTFSFIDNIKSLKIGDYIKLMPNPNNKLSPDAIGAYTVSNFKKIGYVPFKKNQIDIKAKYKIEKINLTQQNPILLISREYKNSNIIQISKRHFDDSMHKNKLKDTIEFKHYIKYLQNSGNIIKDASIIYCDDNYIDICIETEEDINYFHTITKKYYDEHIFIYDEFYNLGLIPRCTYKPFLMHGLEIYIELKYKSINKLLKKKNIKSIKNNFIFKESIIDKNITDAQTFLNANILNDLQIGGLCYNHDLKSYCLIDLYNDNNIVDIIYDVSIINNLYYNYLLLKLIISVKKIINIYIITDKKLMTLEIDSILLDNIKNLL